METERSDFRTSLAALVEATYEDPADHPAIERWRAYLRGELTPGEEEGLQDHLIRCRPCVDLLQLLDGFLGSGPDEAADESPPATADDRAAEPPALRSRTARPTFEPLFGALRRRWLGLAAAAGLAAVAGLSAWVAQQHRAIVELEAELHSPRLDGEVIDLGPGVERSRPESDAPPGRPLVLLLAVPGPASDAERRVTLRDEGGEAVWTVAQPESGRRPGLVEIHLASGLAAGRYRIDVDERRGRGWVPLAEYRLTIGGADAP